MFITVKKWTIIYVLCIIMVLFGFGAIYHQKETVQTLQTQSLSIQMPTLILDPGHGGEDGGAVAQDGTIESDINLSIALCAADIARFLDWNVCMTRSEDISIHDEDAVTLRQKKASDLKNRVEFCNETANGVLISFHQNSLPGSPNVHGAQAFYNEAAGSRELAEAVQNALNETVNSGSPKTAKSIGESSYLMKNADCPSVLIECSFLSNPSDVRLVNTPEYRMQLAGIIIAAVTTHLSGY